MAPVERIVTGRRLLGISRTVLKRSCLLAFAWRMTGEARYAERLEAEIRAVSAFSDWNPSHFLDVAEMATAVAIAVDWAEEGMLSEVVSAAKTALIEKGISPSLVPGADYWANVPMNWNQVCNTGMAAAALVTFSENREKSTRVINRMLRGIPHVLETYAPDGIYVEGATYWEYGTGYNVLLLSLLETSLGTDFGFSGFTGFMESADFVGLVKGPTGRYYNFFDCGERSDFSVPLLWFGMKTGEARYLQADAIEDLADANIDPTGQGQRLAPLGLLWYVHATPTASHPLPLNWTGGGENPLVIFRSANEESDALYFAAKGGKGTLNHGNMDAGSFILELDGVRWAIDPGNQGYHELEEIFKEIGGSLWGNFQDSRRWTLLTKNNFGHNTLTIDGFLHVNDGPATLLEFDGEARMARFSMTGPLRNRAKRATRTLHVIDDDTVEVIDEVTLQPYAETLTWQMLTQAEVSLHDGGATLIEDGKRLQLVVKAPADVNFSVISLDPPPLYYDKVIPGLKRLELKVPAYTQEGGTITIHVEIGR